MRSGLEGCSKAPACLASGFEKRSDVFVLQKPRAGRRFCYEERVTESSAELREYFGFCERSKTKDLVTRDRIPASRQREEVKRLRTCLSYHPQREVVGLIVHNCKERELVLG